MTVKHVAPSIIKPLVDALSTVYWFKNDLQGFLLSVLPSNPAVRSLDQNQKRLDQELTAVNRDLQTLSVDLDQNEQYLSMAIDLAQRAADTYRRAPEQIRRMLNQIFFERLDVRMTSDDEHRIEAVMAPPFKDLFDAAHRTHLEQPRIAAPKAKDQKVENQKIPAVPGEDLPSGLSVPHGLVSNKNSMVGLTGFEPATP